MASASWERSLVSRWWQWCEWHIQRDWMEWDRPALPRNPAFPAVGQWGVQTPFFPSVRLTWATWSPCYPCKSSYVFHKRILNHRDALCVLRARGQKHRERQTDMDSHTQRESTLHCHVLTVFFKVISKMIEPVDVLKSWSRKTLLVNAFLNLSVCNLSQLC